MYKNPFRFFLEKTTSGPKKERLNYARTEFNITIMIAYAVCVLCIICFTIYMLSDDAFSFTPYIAGLCIIFIISSIHTCVSILFDIAEAVLQTSENSSKILELAGSNVFDHRNISNAATNSEVQTQTDPNTIKSVPNTPNSHNNTVTPTFQERTTTSESSRDFLFSGHNSFNQK